LQQIIEDTSSPSEKPCRILARGERNTLSARAKIAVRCSVSESECGDILDLNDALQRYDGDYVWIAIFKGTKHEFAFYLSEDGIELLGCIVRSEASQ
jgi:hypothetical protein